MKIDPSVKQRIIRNSLLSVLLYALPAVLMFAAFSIQDVRPWEHPAAPGQGVASILHTAAASIHGDRFLWFVFALGVLEFTVGMYGEEWSWHE